MLSNTAEADTSGNQPDHSVSIGKENPPGTDKSAELLSLPSDWRLVRVGSNKAPIGGKDWFDRDNYSPDEAASLNGNAPPAWGLKCGPASGVVVLDLDADGWAESFQLVTGHSVDDLPLTIEWTSGKPGRSGKAFQVDAEWWPHLANRRSWKNAKGETCWELRGDRCQSVIIGAHPETGAYSWLPGLSPAWCPDPEPAPDWLLEALLVQELPEVQPMQPSAADADRAVAMLDKIPPTDHSSYDSWLRVGMALHHTDAGLLTSWVSWSRGMDSFDEGECLAKWDSFGKGHKGRSATIATLHHLAKQYGYKEPKRQRVKASGHSKPKPQPQPDATPTTDPVSLPASFQYLIQGLPDGWTETENGMRKSKISVGEMALLIEGKKGTLLRFNEMTMYVEAKTINGWQVVNDAEMDSSYVLLDQKGWIVSLESVIKAVCHVARQRSVHPVREYLLRIEQDATIKPYDLDKVGPDMFRAVQPLHAAMMRKWLIGAAARVLRPGCQMDYCLVLHSRQQGMFKSSALTELASEDWHTSSIPKDDKDFLLNVHSKWIYELAELESITNKRAAGELKNTITIRADNFRVPYGRTAEQRKRASVFCGSANTDSFLRDETGSRRYWVVPIEGKEKLNIDAIKKQRDSIWKAAVLAHRSGELPMLSEEQEALSERQNDGFQAQDAWLEMLQSWMAGYALARFSENDPSPRSYQVDGYYTAAEILYSAGLKRPDQINNHDATRLGPLLRDLGFTSKRVEVEKSKVRRWTT
jgi:predicted P-loop ATPase